MLARACFLSPESVTTESNDTDGQRSLPQQHDMACGPMEWTDVPTPLRTPSLPKKSMTSSATDTAGLKFKRKKDCVVM